MDPSVEQQKGKTTVQQPPAAGGGALLGIGVLLGTLVTWGALQGGLVLVAGKSAAAKAGSGADALEPVLLASSALFSVLALVGVAVGLVYFKRQWVLQRDAFARWQQAQVEQGALICGQLARMEAEWSQQRAQDEAMAEPQLNVTGGNMGGNIKRVEFENAGATVMQLSIQCETPGYFAEMEPRLVLRSSESGHVNIVGCAGRTDADVAVTISYVTHLGKRSAKHFVVPADNYNLVEAPTTPVVGID